MAKEKLFDFDYTFLKARIIEVFGSNKEFIKRLGIAPISFYRKINGQTSWSQEEIIKTCDLLWIQHGLIPIYFFSFSAKKCKQ